MIITTQLCVKPSSTKQISAEITSALSASGSKNFPKFVIKLCFLAIFPSIKSVRLAKTKSTKAISPLYPIKSANKKNTKKGTMTILKTVSLLGRFITILILIKKFYSLVQIYFPIKS